MSSPKGLPSPMHLNGNLPPPRRSTVVTHKELVPTHQPSTTPNTRNEEEIIQYVSGEWYKVKQDLERFSHQNGAEKGTSGSPVYFKAVKENLEYLKDFKPVDLNKLAQARAQQKSDPRPPHHH